MAGRKSDFTLPTLDDLFSTQELRDDAKLSKIRDIPLELIDDFPDHPFKVRDDEDIYNDEIDQYFSYREWKKKHQPLSGVTVREILTTEDLNEGALLRIFDGVTAAFYKSDEYNSREYRYSNLSELRKAMKHKEDGTNGKAQ